MEKENLYYVGFSHFLGIGPMKFAALMKYYKSAKKAYFAEVKELAQIVGAKTAEKFADFRKTFDLEKTFQKIIKKKITIIPFYSEFYPPQIKNISDPPICLYVRGDLNKINFAMASDGGLFFAVVGTRKPTPYGEQIVKKFAGELAEAGFIIVSGLAMGIDSLAHKSAVALNKKTIAFLGCGVDVIYPSTNYKLYYEIIDKGGLIISEFPPTHTVLPGLFIARNRLISGLSLAVFFNNSLDF